MKEFTWEFVIYFKYTSPKKSVAAIINTANVTGFLLRTICITNLILITKKQTEYIHTKSCVIAADSGSSSLFNSGIVLESKPKVTCSKGSQQKEGCVVIVMQRE